MTVETKNIQEHLEALVDSKSSGLLQSITALLKGYDQNNIDINSKYESVEVEIVDINTSIANINTTLVTIQQHLDTLGGGVDLTNIINQVNTLDAKLTDTSNTLISLSNRVSVTELQIQTINESIDNLNTQYSSMIEIYNNLNSLISSIDLRLTDLQQQVADYHPT